MRHKRLLPIICHIGGRGVASPRLPGGQKENQRGQERYRFITHPPPLAPIGQSPNLVPGNALQLLQVFQGLQQSLSTITEQLTVQTPTPSQEVQLHDFCEYKGCNVHPGWHRIHCISRKRKEHVAKIEIERVAERGAGLSGGREIAKKQKTSGGQSPNEGGHGPPRPPRSYAPDRRYPYLELGRKFSLYEEICACDLEFLIS